MKKKLLFAIPLLLLILGTLFFSIRYYNKQQFIKNGAVSVSRQGSFDLDMSPDDALPLFTAPGEVLWVPHWNPKILKGNGTETGTVFVTSFILHTAYWTVLDYDTENHHARYILVAPGVKTGTVDVSIKPNGNNGSRVFVSYDLTALSQNGNDKLKESFNESKYAQMMIDWKGMIEENRVKIDEHFGR